MKLLRFTLTALVLTAPVFGDELLPATKSIPEVVDHYVDAALKAQNVQPAPLADDVTILRRLTLDLNGRIPTVAEVEAYLSSTDPDKKTQLVDRLLSAPAFQRHHANELEAMLASPLANGRNGGRGGVREYLMRAVKDNRSWDAIFRDLILADESDPATKGAGQFLKSRIKDLDRLTTEVSSLFFGINVSCAQCHDHPLVQDWKQDHYFGMKSFFARTYEHGQFLGERDVALVEFKTTSNETKRAKLMFLTGKVVDAPGGDLTPEEIKKLREQEKRRNQRNDKSDKTPPPPPSFSARRSLVELALEPGQRDLFSRSIVNRIWQRFFGLGLVTPLDQMHSENLPSHPELLDWLARDVAENGYDLKRLIRGLVLSNAYARSSRYEGERWPPLRLFAVARLRALTPMQLATSLRLATMDPEQFPSTLSAEELDRKIESQENAARGFANQFDHPGDDFQIGVSEALLFSNNDRVQRDFLADGNDRLVGRLLKANSAEEAIDLAVKATLSRSASSDEKQAMVEYLAQRQDRSKDAYKQLVWALLTSAEFRFNH